MTDTSKPNETIVQIQASASLMTFDVGIYCIFLNAPVVGTITPGFPAVKVSQAPNMPHGFVAISTLDEENFISGAGGAALVRVNRGPAQVLVTSYRLPDDKAELPGVQVARLGGPNVPEDAARVNASQPGSGAGDIAANRADNSEIMAHIRQRGDVAEDIGTWVGEPGSEKWIEGFSIFPKALIAAEDIEYQAMLGKGWLSPWMSDGAYCGSRGMALPILGLRIRLKEEAKHKAQIFVETSFTDGTRIAETNADAVISAESHAPLEAFRLRIVSVNEAAVNGSVTTVDASEPGTTKKNDALMRRMKNVKNSV